MITLKSTSLIPRTAPAGPTSLDANTASLVNNQTIADLTKRGDGNPGVIDMLNTGEVINSAPIPPKVTVTVTNNVASDDLLDIDIFNNSYLNAAPGSTVIAYSDGFDGKLLEKLIGSVNNGKGLLFYGFNVTGYDKDGVKSDVVLNESNLTVNYSNGTGKNAQPYQIDLAGSERNTQFKDGLLTVKVPFIVNILAQMRMSLGGNGAKMQFTFFTQPMK